MGLDSIWDEDGEYLTKKSKGFSARSTGCSCCSSELFTEESVRKEVIKSLQDIFRAVRFFKWDIDILWKEAKKEVKSIDSSPK